MKVLFYTILIVLLDQVSKILVKGFSIPFLNIDYSGMYHGQRINVLGDFFRLTFIENPGMAFGVDPGTDLKLYLSLFSLVASIGLIIYMYKIKDEHISTRISLAFILGGAIGNLIDRMFYGVLYGYAPLFHGKVVDFLDFDFFDVNILGRSYDRFPIFNIADSAVTIGVILLLIFYNNLSRKEESEVVTEENMPTENIDASQDSAASDEIIPGENSIPGDQKKRNRENDEPDNGKEIPL